MKSTKITQTQLFYCKKITTKIFQLKISYPFHRSNQKIKEDNSLNQIDLEKILQNIDSNIYSTLDQWKNDIEQLWSNAKKNNKVGTLINSIAETLSRYYNQKIINIPTNEFDMWLNNINKINQKINEIKTLMPNSTIIDLSELTKQSRSQKLKLRSAK